MGINELSQMTPIPTPAIEPTSEIPPSAPVIATGVEWIVDATGCDFSRLAELSAVRDLCEAIVLELQLNVLGKPQWQQFPAPGGVTGLYLLSESHLACHTYPEFGLVTLNLYCCRPQVVWPWERELKSRMHATDVAVSQVARGAGCDGRTPVAGSRR